MDPTRVPPSPSVSATDSIYSNISDEDFEWLEIESTRSGSGIAPSDSGESQDEDDGHNDVAHREDWEGVGRRDITESSDHVDELSTPLSTSGSTEVTYSDEVAAPYTLPNPLVYQSENDRMVIELLASQLSDTVNPFIHNPELVDSSSTVAHHDAMSSPDATVEVPSQPQQGKLDFAFPDPLVPSPEDSLVFHALTESNLTVAHNDDRDFVREGSRPSTSISFGDVSPSLLSSNATFPTVPASECGTADQINEKDINLEEDSEATPPTAPRALPHSSRLGRIHVSPVLASSVVVALVAVILGSLVAMRSSSITSYPSRGAFTTITIPSTSSLWGLGKIRNSSSTASKGTPQSTTSSGVTSKSQTQVSISNPEASTWPEKSSSVLTISPSPAFVPAETTVEKAEAVDPTPRLLEPTSKRSACDKALSAFSKSMPNDLSSLSDALDDFLSLLRSQTYSLGKECLYYRHAVAKKRAKQLREDGMKKLKDVNNRVVGPAKVRARDMRVELTKQVQAVKEKTKDGLKRHESRRQKRREKRERQREERRNGKDGGTGEEEKCSSKRGKCGGKRQKGKSEGKGKEIEVAKTKAVGKKQSTFDDLREIFHHSVVALVM